MTNFNVITEYYVEDNKCLHEESREESRVKIR